MGLLMLSPRKRQMNLPGQRQPWMTAGPHLPSPSLGMWLTVDTRAPAPCKEQIPTEKQERTGWARPKSSTGYVTPLPGVAVSEGLGDT